MFVVTNYGNIAPAGTFTNATQTGSFVSIIVGIITIVAGLYFLINFAMGGLGYATGGGDEKELTKARKTITNSLLGFILVVSSYFIVGFVGKRLGFSTLFNPTISGFGAGGYYCTNLVVNNTENHRIHVTVTGSSSSGVITTFYDGYVNNDTTISGITFSSSSLIYAFYYVDYVDTQMPPVLTFTKALRHSDLKPSACVDVSN